MKKIYSVNNQPILVGGNYLSKNYTTLQSDVYYVLELNETSGDVAYDASFMGNNFTLNSQYLNYTGKLNKSVLVTDYFNNIVRDLPDLYQHSYNMTMSFWIKFYEYNSSGYSITFLNIKNEVDTSSKIIVSYNNTTNKVTVGVLDNSGDEFSFSPVITFNDKVWNHIAFSLVESSIGYLQIIIYVNGVKYVTDNYYVAHRTYFQFGEIDYTSNTGYAYYLDQTALFNRVLTDEEIATIYNSGNGLEYINW